MARIYDNIDLKFEDGLNQTISSPGVKRVDFCVGYFNLRGWKLVVNQVDQLQGDYVEEKRERPFRTCRLLIGMHRPQEEYIMNNEKRGGAMIGDVVGLGISAN